MYAVYAYKKAIKKEVRLTTSPSSKEDAERLLKHFKNGLSEEFASRYKEWKIKLWR